MVTKQPQLNILVQSKPLKNYTKYFFIMLHIVLTLDFGFIKPKSRKINILVKLMTFTLSTVFTVIIGMTIFDNNVKNVYTYLSFFLDTIVYYVITVHFLFVKNTFHDYQSDLNIFDAEIGVDTRRVENKIINGFSLLIIYRTFIFSTYHAFSLDYIKFPILSQVIYFFGLVGLDMVLVVITYVFYSAHLRLKYFTDFVMSSKDIASCQHIYKNLVEMIENMKSAFDFAQILTLLANTTDVTMLIYMAVSNHKVKQASLLHMVLAYIIGIQQMVILFCPSFTAGLLANQADKLKLVLYDKMVTGDECISMKDIRRFVAYIEGRPLRFLIWRVVPLDWRLPLVVLNIAVTYLIVMIQFTHKD